MRRRLISQSGGIFLGSPWTRRFPFIAIPVVIRAVLAVIATSDGRRPASLHFPVHLPSGLGIYVPAAALIVIDMQNPAKPEIVGRYWLPGMNLAAGEKGDWPLARGRYGLHHAVIADDIAYCAWRDGCLASVDVKDKSDPKLIVHRNWAPPFGGGTHNCLPLTDRNLLIVLDEAVLDRAEDGFKPIWVFDNQVKSNPISIATFPLPNDRDYVAVGGHFGPHNIHENRPGSFQSSTLIFATYQNAGVRAYDIADPFRPVEVGACVPPAPKKLVDPRPNRPVVLHSADVFVDKNGLCYCTDWSGAGLYIMEYLG